MATDEPAPAPAASVALELEHASSSSDQPSDKAAAATPGTVAPTPEFKPAAMMRAATWRKSAGSGFGDAASVGWNAPRLESMVQDMEATLHAHESMLQNPPWLADVHAALQKMDRLEVQVSKLSGRMSDLEQAVHTTQPRQTPAPGSEEDGSTTPDNGELPAQAVPVAQPPPQRKLSRDCPSESLTRLAEAERVARVEHQLYRLTVNVGELQAACSAAPSRGDMARVREDQRAMFRQLSDLVDDRHAQAQQALDDTLKTDLAKLKSWMLDHDELMAQRSERFLKALDDLRDHDVRQCRDLIDDHKEQQIRDQAGNTAELARLNVAIMNGLHRDKIKLIAKKLIFKDAHTAFVHWKRVTEFEAELEVLTYKAKRIMRPRILFRLGQAMDIWRVYVGFMSRAKKAMLRAANQMVAVVLRKVTSFAERAFLVWKTDWMRYKHISNREHFKATVFAAKDIPTQIQLIADEIELVKTLDHKGIHRVIAASQDRLLQTMSQQATAQAKFAQAERERVDAALSRLLEELVPTIDARVERTDAKVKELVLGQSTNAANIEQLQKIAEQLQQSQSGDATVTKARLDGLQHQLQIGLDALDEQLRRLKDEHDELAYEARETIKDSISDLELFKGKLLEFQRQIKDIETHVTTETSRLSTELHTVTTRNRHECLERVAETRSDVRELDRLVDDHRHDVVMGKVFRPEARFVAVLCSRYEDSAQETNYCPPFPDAVPPPVAEWATSGARWIAEVANSEALEQVFAGSNPEQLVYAEDQLVQRRTQLRTTLLQEVQTEAELCRPNAGALRMEARKKFNVRLAEALDVALTKFEAVVTLTNTCFGKKQAVPSCVACDRPLPTRIRNTRDPSAASKVVGDGHAHGAGKGPAARPRNNAPGIVAQAEAAREAARTATFARTTLEAASEGGAAGGGAAAGHGGPGGQGPTTTATYVMRSGFRMPVNAGSRVNVDLTAGNGAGGDGPPLSAMQRALLADDAEQARASPPLDAAATDDGHGKKLVRSHSALPSRQTTALSDDLPRGKMRPRSALARTKSAGLAGQAAAASETQT